jgi:hypothetical protein
MAASEPNDPLVENSTTLPLVADVAYRGVEGDLTEQRSPEPCMRDRIVRYLPGPGGLFHQAPLTRVCFISLFFAVLMRR